MSQDPRRSDPRWAQAVALEQRGLVDAAVQAYQALSAPEEAARVLTANRRFLDAGHLLMETLGAKEVRSWDPAQRKLATVAASCFSRAGEHQAAADLFVALGDRERAMDLLRRAGDMSGAARIQSMPASSGGKLNMTFKLGQPGQGVMTLAGAQKLEAAGKRQAALEAYASLKQFGAAARMAEAMNDPMQAAKFYVDAGQHAEAARCYQAVGATGEALSCLTRVPKDSPQYRPACAQAVKLATELNVLDFPLENFLSKYVSLGPQTDGDLSVFYALARLYRNHDYPENARDALLKIQARHPKFMDVGAQLQELAQDQRGSDLVYAKILKEDADFHRSLRQSPPKAVDPAQGLPELPDLPDLPDLPTLAEAPRGAPAGRAPAPESRSGALPPPSASQVLAAPTGAAARMAETFAAIPATPRPPQAASASGSMAAAPPTLVEAPVQFVPGATINQRYVIEKKIGQGGMADVFKVLDQQ